MLVSTPEFCAGGSCVPRWNTMRYLSRCARPGVLLRFTPDCLSHTKLRHMCNSNVVILCFRNIPGFGRDALDHLVVLEGYGTDETTGEDYWLVRNSWGPLWGEQGYVRLKRVDPSTLDDPDSDCGLDTTPADGVACTKDEKGNDVIPPPEKICGNSGILYDATIPLGGYII